MSRAGSTPSVRPSSGRRTATARNVALAIVVVGALIVGGRYLGAYVPRFTERVDALGAWGPIVFCVGYVIAAVAFVPGSLLTLAAGAIFGLVKGTLVVLVGATLGSSAAFLVSRYAARQWVEKRLRGNSQFASIDRAIGQDGRRIAFLLRLSPVIPFNLLNYALGLTTIRFADFVVASVGMVPGTLLYVYYGKLAGDVASLTGGTASPRGTGYYVLLVLGLVATVVVTTIVTRLARRALAQATAGSSDAAS